MRVTTLYLEDDAASVTYMSAPTPDQPPTSDPTAPAAPSRPATPQTPATAPAEVAWDAFERETFPDLHR